jgi:hypothetical protein
MRVCDAKPYCDKFDEAKDQARWLEMPEGWPTLWLF